MLVSVTQCHSDTTRVDEYKSKEVSVITKIVIKKCVYDRDTSRLVCGIVRIIIILVAQSSSAVFLMKYLVK